MTEPGHDVAVCSLKNSASPSYVFRTEGEAPNVIQWD